MSRRPFTRASSSACLSRNPFCLWAALTALLVAASPRQASADWLVTPFIGRTLQGDASLQSFDRGASSQHWVFGGAGTWLSDGLLGAEVEATFVPRFFERNGQALANTGSRVTTLSGNLIVALPTAVTRESLRPYIVGGVGLLHARIDNLVFPVDRKLLGLSIGGGAIGGLGERTAVRFDLRHVRSVRGEGEPATQPARLSFWRAAVGLTLRY
jgi:hypothetical protein